MVNLVVIDARDIALRTLARVAMQEALSTGIAAAAPPIPQLVAIVMNDEKPIVRLLGNGWDMGNRRAQETRPLKDEEKELPASRILSGYGHNCGGLAWTPNGFLRVGHELEFVTDEEAACLYNLLAVRDDSTPEMLRELCQRVCQRGGQ